MKKQKYQKISDKRKREQCIVEEMITLYCRKRHKNISGKKLCPECDALCGYAKARSEHCPFMEQKTFCSNCKVHCYQPDMREKIREVMIFSGPRMLRYHPKMALWHLISSKWENHRLKHQGGKQDD